MSRTIAATMSFVALALAAGAHAGNEAIAAAARLQVGVTLHYDPVYRKLAYPQQRHWGQSKPDTNIDHRRVPNLMT